KLGFSPLAAPQRGVFVVFADNALQFGAQTRAALKAAGDLIERAAESEDFKGKLGGSLELVHPVGLGVSRLVVLGVGNPSELKPRDFVRLGGIAAGKLGAAMREATVFCELPRGALKPDQAADVALGLRLRSYKFDRYKTKRKEDEERSPRGKVMLATRDPAAAR